MEPARWRDIALLRNRLAHGYPTDAGRQCAVLSAAWAAAPQLLGTVAAATAHVTRKRLLD